MINLYKILLLDDNISEIEAFYDLLPEKLKRRIKDKNKEEKIRSTACYYLLNDALQTTGHSLLDLYYSDSGKPLIDGIFLSFSHKDKMCVLALSDTPCGVDTEKIEKKDYKALSRFSKKEQEIARNSPYGFMELWTKKEALIKLTGEGIKGLISADIFDENINFFMEEASGYLITAATLKK
ncbi:MAG: 4'-phosphopantetheinyl transferase superfamily protein [Clostridia bacterium]|nr:4'-phosphopantetheinyl transferase superfamily protein [Clostridia bacterium]